MFSCAWNSNQKNVLQQFERPYLSIFSLFCLQWVMSFLHRRFSWLPKALPDGLRSKWWGNIIYRFFFKLWWKRLPGHKKRDKLAVAIFTVLSKGTAECTYVCMHLCPGEKAEYTDYSKCWCNPEILLISISYFFLPATVWVCLKFKSHLAAPGCVAPFPVWPRCCPVWLPPAWPSYLWIS